MRISDWSSDVCSSDLPRHCNDCDAPGLIAASAGSVAAAPALPPTVSVDARIDAGIAVARMYSPTHRLTVQHRGTDWQAQLGDAIEASDRDFERSEEHTSELQSLMRHSYAVFCLKKKINI